MGSFTIVAPYPPEDRFKEETAALDRTPRLHRYAGFRSRHLPGDREIFVYLPPQYFEQPERRFATLYLHDGQNLIDPRTSHIPGQTWRAHATVDRLAAAGQIESLILVGIFHAGVRRITEYTPSSDPELGGGEGENYARFLVEELKPFVDSRYRTLPETERTGLGGSSLGGLISLWTGFHFPGVFGRLAVLSPSLWWTRRSIFDDVERLSPEPKPRIWLDIGLLEGGRHVRNAAAMAALLRRKGWDEAHLRYLEEPAGTHSEEAWAARLGDVLRFLFPA
ncbi:MAG: alpha/beta hydrolase [Acidobacteriaceae bacterium]|nr:alpha/beta hydrolase [Acidobacteriaceae bacterium]